MGNYKKVLMLTIALRDECVNRKIVCRLSDDLNEELKTHIDNVGKNIYKR